MAKIAYDNEKGGRPPKYDETDHPDRAYDLIVSCGANFSKIAKQFHVNHAQIGRWYARYQEFRTKIDEARAMWFGQDLQAPLIKLCKGFKVIETTKEISANDGKIISSTKVSKYYPPSIHALKFALTNYAPHIFQERKELKLDTPAPLSLIINTSGDDDA